MKDKLKISNITLIKVTEDKNGENGGKAISEEIKAKTFQEYTLKQENKV